MEVDHGQAQRAVLPKTKIRIITIVLRRVLSEIKLKRTDTTLDLSPVFELRLAHATMRMEPMLGGDVQKAKRAKEEKRKGKEMKEGCEGLNIPSCWILPLVRTASDRLPLWA